VPYLFFFIICNHSLSLLLLSFHPSLSLSPSLPFPFPLSQDLLILETLGRGSSATVYKALHLSLVQLMALKSISIFEQDKRKQLAKELNIFTSLHSPYIIGMGSGIFSCFFLLLYVCCCSFLDPVTHSLFVSSFFPSFLLSLSLPLVLLLSVFLFFQIFMVLTTSKVASV
jgi:serine/threonine protein kinase